MTPPIHLDAEKAVLSCILQSPGDSLARTGRYVNSTDFHHPAHRIIYDACLSVWRGLETLDPMLLTEALRKAGKLEAIGGPSIPIQLLTFEAGITNAEHYAAIMRETSHRRRIWQVCEKVSKTALEHGSDVGVMSGELTELLSGLVVGDQREIPFSDHVSAALERYEEAFNRKGARAPGVLPTGLKGLDDEIEGGFHPTDLIVIAAETSGGKTALAVQAASKAAVDWEAHVLIASYEMSAAQLTDRIIALASGISSNKLRGGFLSEWDFNKLTNSVTKLNDAGIHLRDKISHWTVDDVATEARAIQARHGLGMVIVDYLQLANPKPATKGRQINREREVADMSRSLKSLAKELRIPVVALSQLTDGKLRESRAIGHDADVVLIIGDAYDEDDKKRQNPLEDQRIITIDKNRHGARDKQVRVGWKAPLMQFS